MLTDHYLFYGLSLFTTRPFTILFVLSHLLNRGIPTPSFWWEGLGQAIAELAFFTPSPATFFLVELTLQIIG